MDNIYYRLEVKYVPPNLNKEAVGWSKGGEFVDYDRALEEFEDIEVENKLKAKRLIKVKEQQIIIDE